MQFNNKVSQTLWRSGSVVDSSSDIWLFSQLLWNEYEFLGFVNVQYLDMHYGEQLQHLIRGWKCVKNFQAKSYGLYQNRSLFQLSNSKEHIWVVPVHQGLYKWESSDWLPDLWELGQQNQCPRFTLCAVSRSFRFSFSFFSLICVVSLTAGNHFQMQLILMTFLNVSFLVKSHTEG